MANGIDFDMSSFQLDDAQVSGISHPKPALLKHHSARSSIVSTGARNGKHGVMAKCKCCRIIPRLNALADVLTDLYKQVSSNQWMEHAEDEEGNPISSLNLHRGVVLQREDGSYVAHPANLNEEVIKAVLRLDVPIAFTMSSEVTSTLVNQISPEQKQFGDPRSGITLPVVDSIDSLASGRASVSREAFICLCRREQFVLVWGETVSLP